MEHILECEIPPTILLGFGDPTLLILEYPHFFFND